MKKLMGVLFCLGMLTFESVTVPTEVEPQSEIIQSQSVIQQAHILTDRELSRLYTCRQDKREIDGNIVEISIEEAQLLMQVANTEAGDTLDGQLWSMRVIINRLNNGSFGDSISEIINADKQFEVVKTGAYKKAKLTPESHIALAMIESGWDETQGALYWEADTNTDNSWHKQNLTYIATVEGQRYYR